MTNPSLGEVTELPPERLAVTPEIVRELLAAPESQAWINSPVRRDAGRFNLVAAVPDISRGYLAAVAEVDRLRAELAKLAAENERLRAMLHFPELAAAVDEGNCAAYELLADDSVLVCRLDPGHGGDHGNGRGDTWRVAGALDGPA